MFVFGHLGIGNKVASPWSRELPKVPLFIGMLLPDLIDKPLFYLPLWLHLQGPFWGTISCTRTFGHTGIFLFLLLGAAGLAQLVSCRRPAAWLAALALGVSTHLLLDCLIDRVSPHSPGQPGAAFVALTWPFLYSRFAAFPFRDLRDHLLHLVSAPILISEGVGLGLLGWDYWKSRHRGAILKVLFSRRWRVLKRRRLERD